MSCSNGIFFYWEIISRIRKVPTVTLPVLKFHDPDLLYTLCTDDDGMLACVPLHCLVMLGISYIPIKVNYRLRLDISYTNSSGSIY
jgi:hypothetical protein